MRIKINEVFSSLQGEGRFAGFPVVFVRVSGCTRACKFCDTAYHVAGSSMSTRDLAEQIKKFGAGRIVVFTGGEPLLQWGALEELVGLLQEYGNSYHVETNGDLLTNQAHIRRLFRTFSYVAASPKTAQVARRLSKLLPTTHNLHIHRAYSGTYDIKVVTDLEKVGLLSAKYATMLMPLSTYDEVKDREIKARVWDFCSASNLLYSPRLHVDVHGKKRGI